MASIYKRKDSHFWWIKFRDPTTGKTKQQSTKLVEYVRARKLCSEYTFKESKTQTPSNSELWNNWVPGFFVRRYGQTKNTRAHCAWRSLIMFLTEKGLSAPRMIEVGHVAQYIEWRRHPNKTLCKYKACLNTTIMEIKFMSVILDEAVRNNFCSHNPWIKLNLHREKPKVKPELSRHAQAKILWHIRKETEPRKTFFKNSFLIARYHGCRLSETYVNPMKDVSFDERPTITFYTKGGRVHSVFLHPKLIRKFKRLQAAKKTETFEKPRNISHEWFCFLTRTGIKKEFPGACFHSLRVTAATLLARSGISEKKSMDYIGHASTTIHRSYVRLKPDDLAVCAAALD